VIVDSEAGPITRRLAQELDALGFSVRLTTGPSERPLREALDQNHAVAAIEVRSRKPGALDLLMVDPKSGSVIRAELPIEAARDPAAAELVATRAVELLRAARLTVQSTERSLPPSPSARSMPASNTMLDNATPAHMTRAMRGRLTLGAGPILLFSPGWQPSAQFGIAATLLARSRLGGVLQIAIPAIPARVTSPLGAVDGFATTYRLGAAFEAIATRSLALRAQLGAELDELRFRGEALAPYVGGEAHLLTLGPWGSLLASLRLGLGLRFAAALAASWAYPRSVVRFAGSEIRDWGRPCLTGAVGVEWESP
jgi:hypothetical protein